jgi:hypothetical protein
VEKCDLLSAFVIGLVASSLVWLVGTIAYWSGRQAGQEKQEDEA